MSELNEQQGQTPLTDKKPAPRVSSSRHTLNIFTTRVFVLPLQIITSLLVIKALGPQERGIYEFLILLGALIMPILMMGLNASATYLVSTKRYTVNDVFVTCLLISMVQGLLGSAILGVLWHFGWLGKTAQATGPALMLPVLLLLPVQSSTLSLTRLSLGDSWFELNNRAQLAIALLTAGLLWVLVIFGGLGVLGSVIGMAIVNVIVFTGIMVAFLRRYQPKLQVHFTYLREAWRYGLKAWVGDVAVQTNARMDKFVLGIVAPPAVLGVYGPVVMITEMLWIVPDSLAFVVQNKIAAARDKAEQAVLVERLNRIVFWTMTAAGIAVIFAAPPLLVLMWGQAYASSGWLMALLMPGTVAFCISKLLNKYFSGTGRPHLSGMTVIVGGIVGISCYWALIPLWGVSGAAVAHSACYIATSLSAIFIYRKLVAPHKPRLLLPARADAVWLEQQVRTAAGAR